MCLAGCFWHRKPHELPAWATALCRFDSVWGQGLGNGTQVPRRLVQATFAPLHWSFLTVLQRSPHSMAPAKPPFSGILGSEPQVTVPWWPSLRNHTCYPQFPTGYTGQVCSSWKEITKDADTSRQNRDSLSCGWISCASLDEKRILSPALTRAPGQQCTYAPRLRARD